MRWHVACYLPYQRVMPTGTIRMWIENDSIGSATTVQVLDSRADYAGRGIRICRWSAGRASGYRLHQPDAPPARACASGARYQAGDRITCCWIGAACASGRRYARDRAGDVSSTAAQWRQP